MKGSVKSQLNYADIHQSPVVKYFFHKILRLLSTVTNEGSQNPRGLKVLETSPFFISCEQDNMVYLQSTVSSCPKAAFRCTDPQDRFRECAAWVQTSQDMSSPFSPLAPDKCAHNVNSNIHITCL